MSKGKKHIHIVILIVALSFLTFNDLGLIKLISIYNERKVVENEIEELINQENALLNEIKLLETNPQYIEKIAREEFYMAAPGEIIYRVKRDKVLE
tara:strand:- start:127 stop:414 length:288 start_codon:yes stop_codon:yes gene_type:complete